MRRRAIRSRPASCSITLDDVQARAQVASAESGVKTAQAALDAATHNGTQAEQQASAAEVEQDGWRATRRSTIWMRSPNWHRPVRLHQAKLLRPAQRLQTAQASLNAAEQSAQHRYSPPKWRAPRLRWQMRRRHWPPPAMSRPNIHLAPIAGTIYTMDAAPSEYSEAGKLLLQMADLKQRARPRIFRRARPGPPGNGQKCQLRWDAKPGREWHGHIVRLPVTVVTYTTRNVGEVLVDHRRPRRRPAARHQCHRDCHHFQPAECSQHAARSTPRTERKILRLQSCATMNSCASRSRSALPISPRFPFSPGLKMAISWPPEQPTVSPCRKAYRSR